MPYSIPYRQYAITKLYSARVQYSSLIQQKILLNTYGHACIRMLFLRAKCDRCSFISQKVCVLCGCRFRKHMRFFYLSLWFMRTRIWLFLERYWNHYSDNRELTARSYNNATMLFQMITFKPKKKETMSFVSFAMKFFRHKLAIRVTFSLFIIHS